MYFDYFWKMELKHNLEQFFLNLSFLFFFQTPEVCWRTVVVNLLAAMLPLSKKVFKTFLCGVCMPIFFVSCQELDRKVEKDKKLRDVVVS